jgi:hypothetical protein
MKKTQINTDSFRHGLTQINTVYKKNISVSSVFSVAKKYIDSVAK